MRLTVVGCSGTVPSPTSAASSYLVQATDPDDPDRTWQVLLDLGNGALGPAQRYVDPVDVDAVLLTHLHADHCLDLCGLYVMLKHAPRTDDLGAVLSPRRPRVWGPDGTADRMARAYDLPIDPGMHVELDFRTWVDREPLQLGPLTITPVRVEHPVPTFGLRVLDRTTGGVLAYTGDTDACAPLDDLCIDADVVLADAAFVEGRDDDKPGVHLTAARAGRMATRAGGVKRLVLTHLPPWNDPHESLAEARTTWGGPLDVAVPGMTIDL